MNKSLDIRTNFLSIFKFAFPNILLMMFLSFYVMVDGMFVSRFVGSDALAALNIVYPIISIAMAFGIMFGAGGSAICAIKLGRGQNEQARQDFVAITFVSVICGIIITAICLVFIDELIYMLGARGDIIGYGYDYLMPSIFFITATIVQAVFQFFLITAGKPVSALILTLIGGITNIVLDYVFIVLLDLGVTGAAVATGLGALFGSLYGVSVFVFSKKGSLYFVKLKFNKGTILKTFSNGSSEMVNNIAGALTMFLFNYSMLKIAGENGVAAITIILYAQFLLNSIYMGYAGGVAPLISFNHGRQNFTSLKTIIKNSLIFLFVVSIIVVTVSVVFAPQIVGVFASSDINVAEMATQGLRIFATGFVFSGLNIFISCMFTAFSNGKISALVSFFRTFICIVSALLILQNLIGINGVWISVPLAELLSLILGLILFFHFKKIYKY